ncbi:SusC/RagA family TonB-linked outer membrane protein [Algoriphagus machipongonensis]|uniref:Outer membrane protein probably involved in nutrient binding n=1 Tax=Algoriphagus machipongonensis TaxID=388413 RepID=A3HZ55_9BACT|nr:SusC/RagA family TonB-linked outer membrane protein [Algoriphagus machipongonensis]EAZ80541.1 putative outer membrane protein probably involved in nutrient binding [Algoriphagus machipongonensis]
MKKTFTFFTLLMLLSPGFLLAQVQVKGKVSDETGEGLPGVTVLVKGTTKGTIADFEGNYTISADENAVLVFSFIGFETKEEAINGRSIINLTLNEDSRSLDEVVVTAIGIKQQKKKLGYATQEVPMDVVGEASTLNLGNALTGQIAGLTVNNPTGMFQSPSFSLRGKSPLIVLDGIPVETDLFDISPEDIESINVLKGGSASALYGSRGKNGAILITRKNASKEGLTITATTNNMVTAGFTVFPETQTEYGNGSNGQYEFWDGADGGISDGDMIWGPKFEPGVMVPQWNSPIRDKVTGEEIEWYGNVAGTVYDDKSRYERVPTPWVRHDNLKDFIRTGVVTKNDLSIAYQGEKAQFRFSANYAFQRGQVPNTSVNTGGFNFNSSFKLSEKLQLDATLSYNKVYSPNYPRYGYGPKNHMYTILVWMGDDVNGQDLKDHMYVPGLEGYRQANYNYAWYNNVYFAAYELNQVYNRNVVDGKLKLKYQFSPNFYVQGRVSARQKGLFEDMQSPKSYMNYGDSRNGDYKFWNNEQLNLDTDFLAAYSKDFNETIGISVNAGASTFYRSYKQDYSSSDGLIVPYVYSLNNTQGPVQATNYVEDKEIRSVYGSAGIDLWKSIFLNFTARNDWSSTLPKLNNSYFYPSASVSAIVSEFITMPKAIDFIKVYGSWSEVSSDLNPYSIYSTYNKGVTYGSIPSVNYPSSLVNSEIMPQKSTTFEAGLSTSFAQRRLSLEGTYYRILDENQIIDLNISEASGFNSRKVNGNEYTTHGFEVMLNYAAIKREKFSWNIGANWTKFTRSITDIYGGAEKYGNLKEGDRADSYYATVWQKSADGQLILDANTGMPTRDPFPTKIGHLDPSWRFGIQNQFNINKFRIAMDVDGAWGGLIRSLTIEKMWWGGKHPNSTLYRDEEYAAGQPIYVPDGVVVTGGELVRDVDGNIISDSREYTDNTTAVSWQTWSQNYPYRAQVTEDESEIFANVYDRSFLKLRRLSVTYDLMNVIPSKRFKNLDLTVYGYNLFVIKNLPYLDPDFGNDNNLQDPSSRYVGMTLKAVF